MPYPIVPKRSLGIFSGLQQKFAKDDAQAAAAEAQQIALEDRLARSTRQGLQDIQAQEKHQAEVEWLEERVRASRNPVVKPEKPAAPVLRNVGPDLYDVTDPTKPKIVLKAPEVAKSDNGAAVTRQLQRETKLRDDYMADPHVKNAYGISSAAEQIRALAAKAPNPQNDLGIIYQVVKLRDPGSVVREGEIDLQRAARSLGTQIAGAWQKALKGEILTPKERQDILGMVDAAASTAEEQIAPVQAEFGRQSRQYGADSSFVAPSPFNHGNRRPAPAAPAKPGALPTLDPRTFKIGRPG